MGMTFSCPHCVALGNQEPLRVVVWFANPVDGGPAAPLRLRPAGRWRRGGLTFETMTLSPSVNADNGTGHWHGYITAGVIR